MSQLPLFEPESDWTVPDRLPDVPSDAIIAVDTETRDDGLSQSRGPGWVFRTGWIAGVSVSWGASAVYAPVRHPDTANLPVEQVMGWLEDAMRRARRVVMHNASYDCGWLSTENVTIPWERLDDTHAMAVMVDENRESYSLDACCRWRGVPGKDEQKLREAAAAYGLDPKRDMWKMPARFVGSYAEQDAISTLGLHRSLQEEIRIQELTEAYQLEMDLIPMVLEMRRRGIRINEDVADRVTAELRRARDEQLDSLRKQLGWRRLGMDDMLSPGSLERMFTEQSVQFPRTQRTNRGSFKKEWMAASDHWLPKTVTTVRQLDDLAEKFIQSYIVGSSHVGRVHAEVHQLRDDDAGTRSYRFSYSDPPLQQIPARSKFAPLIRGVFEPEQDELWLAADYSQQEPRMAVHFASVCKLSGAEQAVEYYRDNPDADFHTMVAELTGVPRKDAKIINLGLMYGMGLAKLARSLGVDLDTAKAIIEQYNGRMPFVAALNDFCKRRADVRGYIRLLDGARCRFDQWELSYREAGSEYYPPLPREEALKRAAGRRIRRAFTHKSMNRLIQGSSARQTKLAMRACWREGLVPSLQMHDEIDLSVSSPAQVVRVSEIMCDIVTLAVPMKVDCQLGRNWGQASEELSKGTPALTWDEIMASTTHDTVSDILARRG